MLESQFSGILFYEYSVSSRIEMNIPDEIRSIYGEKKNVDFEWWSRAEHLNRCYVIAMQRTCSLNWTKIMITDDNRANGKWNSIICLHWKDDEWTILAMKLFLFANMRSATIGHKGGQRRDALMVACNTFYPFASKWTAISLALHQQMIEEMLKNLFVWMLQSLNSSLTFNCIRAEIKKRKKTKRKRENFKRNNERWTNWIKHCTRQRLPIFFYILEFFRSVVPIGSWLLAMVEYCAFSNSQWQNSSE